MKSVVERLNEVAGRYGYLGGQDLVSWVETQLEERFVAGRRSMREEAANALSMRAQLTDDAVKRGALELCVAMVRAIPEKQS